MAENKPNKNPPITRRGSMTSLEAWQARNSITKLQPEFDRAKAVLASYWGQFQEGRRDYFSLIRQEGYQRGDYELIEDLIKPAIAVNWGPDAGNSPMAAIQALE